MAQSSSVPLCADESVFDDRDTFKLLSEGAVDYLNIKLGESGGINTALRIEAIARSAGSKCMLGCFAETRLALTAAGKIELPDEPGIGARSMFICPEISSTGLYLARRQP